MDEIENLKHLWNSKNTLDTPNLQQIQTVIKKYQNKKKRNAFLLVASFISCGVVLTFIIIFHNPTLWTTTLGKILMLLGFISGLVLKLITLKRITQKNELKSNKDFLEDLIKVTNQKKTKVNWLQIISTLLLAIGYGFYIYEEIKENQTELILSYFGICLFALGMYFIFRPYIKRKSKNKNKKILEVLEALS